MAYLDYWRHWRQQSATVANSERRDVVRSNRRHKKIGAWIDAAAKQVGR
jgi:hypothetical protein